MFNIIAPRKGARLPKGEFYSALHDSTILGQTMENTINNQPDSFEVLGSRPTLSIKEASAYTGLSRSTLYRLMDDGALPFLKPVKGRRMLLRRDLDAFLEAGRKGGHVFA
jgi:excisionase family DNA binding protein